MRVLKFGGTSLANPQRFLQAAALIEKAHLENKPPAFSLHQQRLPIIL